MERLRLDYDREKEDQLLLAGITDDGQSFSSEQCRELLLRLEAVLAEDADFPALPPSEVTDALEQLLHQEEVDEIQNNQEWLDQFYEREQEKLDRWAEDRRQSIRAELKDLEMSIKQQKAEARKMLNLQQKISAQRTIKDLESRLAERKFSQFETEKEIETQKDKFLDDIEARIRQTPKRKPLFTLRWSLVAAAPQTAP